MYNICPFCKKKLKRTLANHFYFCPKCQIAVRSEKNMPAQKQNIYNFDWVIQQEQDLGKIKKAQFLTKIIQKINKVKHILDAGCGMGILVDILTKKGYSAIGIDSSKSAIKFAQKNKEGTFKIANIETYRGKQKYDLILGIQIIEHLRKPEKFLENVRRLLKPKGYLLLETPNLASWDKKSFWRKRQGGIYGQDHRICYKPKSLTDLLQTNGFKIQKITTKTYIPIIFTETLKTTREEKIYKFFIKNQSKTKNKSKLKNKSKQNNNKQKIGFYPKLIYSSFFEAFWTIPNRISEIDHRGNYLIAIARKKD